MVLEISRENMSSNLLKLTIDNDIDEKMWLR